MIQQNRYEGENSMIRKTLLSSLFAVLFCAPLMAQTAPPPPPPTKAQDVNVVNTPSVNVVNTPTVQLAGTSTVQVSGTTNVHVQNDSTAPVVVQDVSTPKRTPFQAAPGFPAPPFLDNNPVSAPIAVPAGKRLVIEHVSARAVVPFTAQTPVVFFSISTTVAGVSVEHVLNVPQVFFFNCGSCGGAGETINSISQEMKLYADAGTTVQGTALSFSITGSPIDIHFAVSGYLEDAP
jgi:hypothetical protein